MNANKSIYWSETDLGDEDKIVLQGELNVNGTKYVATGLTRQSVTKKLNEKLLLNVTGEFLNSSINK